MAPSYKMRSTTESPAIYDPARLDELFPVTRVSEGDGTEEDPFRYGYRTRWETMPDGCEQLRWIPLTYEDTLDPQLGDRVSHDTIHTELTGKVSGILEMRYEDEPTVAVWSDLKVRSPKLGKAKGQRRKTSSTEGAKGPAPDVCVVGGVRDRDRRRESFEVENDPGEIWLAVEVVSKTSEKKDYEDILEPYTELRVREYVAVKPEGRYVDGPVELRAWRFDGRKKRLQEVALDAQGRFRSKTTGLLFGTGPGGQGLEIRDAKTGELLHAPIKEVRRQAERAEQAQKRAEQAQKRAEQAQKRAEQEAKARRAAQKRAEQEAKVRRTAQKRAEQEAKARQAAQKRAEQEAKARRVAEERVEQGLRQGIEDLSAVLGIAWSDERRARVERMSASELKALRTHLVREKSWPV